MRFRLATLAALAIAGPAAAQTDARALQREADRTTIEADGGMLPGVLYDAGLKTITDLL